MRPVVPIAAIVLVVAAVLLINRSRPIPEADQESPARASREGAPNLGGRASGDRGGSNEQADDQMRLTGRPAAANGAPGAGWGERKSDAAAAGNDGNSENGAAVVQDGARGIRAVQGVRHPGSAGADAIRLGADLSADAEGGGIAAGTTAKSMRHDGSASEPAAIESGNIGGNEPPGAAPPQDPSVVYNSGDEARFSTQSEFKVPDAGQNGTASLWVQPEWAPDNQDDATLLKLGDDQIRIFKNVSFIRFEYADPNDPNAGTGIPISDWKPGDWHQITTTWDQNGVSFYADGQLVGKPFPAQLNLRSDTPVLVGSDFPPGMPIAPGALGNIEVRNQVLGPGDIANNFAASPLAPKPQGQ
jgi:hypothetical protein